jgi:UDP:flavonoid glycosyltransferase YjiC (YdhE family)
MTMFAAVAEEMAPDLLSFARAWRPDLVVYEPRAYAGLVAAHALGIPAVRHLWGTDYTYDRWELEGEALRPLFGTYGMREVDPHGELTVDTCPPSLRVAVGGVRQPMRYVPYNGAGVVPPWLHAPASRPRVCVTWGTSMRTAGDEPDPVAQILAAFSGADVEIVLAISARHRAALTIPPQVRVAESMPLHLLLPTCAAVVHQGGAGSTLTSVVSGVPQLVFPAVIDGAVNARGIVAAGAGLSVDTTELGDSGRIRAAVAELLSEPRHREAALKLRAEALAQPTPVTVADRLSQLV